MLAMLPEAVDMTKIDPAKWYTRSAAEASAELGQRGRDLILARLLEVLR
jgi:hypothetical protein